MEIVKNELRLSDFNVGDRLLIAAKDVVPDRELGSKEYVFPVEIKIVEFSPSKNFVKIGTVHNDGNVVESWVPTMDINIIEKIG